MTWTSQPAPAIGPFSYPPKVDPFFIYLPLLLNKGK